MDKLKIIYEIFQTLYLICAGPILVYLAYKGLGQLKIAKKNIKIMSQRDAFKLAGEQCQVFAEKIVPLFAKFKKELSESECDFLEKFEVRNK